MFFSYFCTRNVKYDANINNITNTCKKILKYFASCKEKGETHRKNC